MESDNRLSEVAASHRRSSRLRNAHVHHKSGKAASDTNKQATFATPKVDRCRESKFQNGRIIRGLEDGDEHASIDRTACSADVCEESLAAGQKRKRRGRTTESSRTGTALRRPQTMCTKVQKDRGCSGTIDSLSKGRAQTPLHNVALESHTQGGTVRSESQVMNDSDDDADLVMDPSDVLWSSPSKKTKNRATCKAKRTSKPAVKGGKRDYHAGSSSVAESNVNGCAGSDSDIDRGDASLRIPGEAVLAFFAEDRRYYPAQIKSYNPTTAKYKVSFAQGYTRSLPRNKFHTQFEKAFKMVEVGDIRGYYYHSNESPRRHENNSPFACELDAVLPAIGLLVSGPVDQCRRADAFFNGKVKQLEHNLSYGPFEKDQIDMVVRVVKERFFASLFAKGGTSAEDEGDELDNKGSMGNRDPRDILERESAKTSASEEQTHVGRLPSPPPSQSRHIPPATAEPESSAIEPNASSSSHGIKHDKPAEVKRDISHSEDQITCISESGSSSSLALLSTPLKADKFTRLVLLPEALVRIIMARNNQTYQEAEKELRISVTRNRLNWVEEVMTALHCVVMGEVVGKGRRRLECD
ncbi:uncharacterized protein SPPG_09208 [Spizellomyces punctatus DAOM BR117]|uniref:Uncharacterized protein n=1 Tax=Spizellomyces punctatus (strain DAOM BR117) TaxID=645134 RepID=A0A0L0HFK4_SPIPD|nr:uncharacterized protein SPPG_09208 [Spizellomyces punctatus DAOM BR117]KND00266.1 hypothetical protein SPPG_09208 [Spizellomyces punctatus DAOM BR117]|eukprot:XP_016608305.1 hypothetical protein SPPG_09208 [Spizellomyces punctatus DAOM BR117]